LKETTEGTLLGGRVKYRQLASGHRSGFEPVLLAASVPAKAGQRVLEAGTGAGAALLCLAARVPGVAGIGVEIEPRLAELANENFAINGLLNFSCTPGDVTRLRIKEKFDHAMANPPWHEGAGTKSPDSARALAHHSQAGLLAGWISALAGWLKPRGTMTLILPASAFAEAAAGLRAGGCGAVTLFPLWPRAGMAAKLVIISARLDARGPDRVLNGLILHDEAGITAQAQAVLRAGAALWEDGTSRKAG
jgi:tRNA1(Val) A37 N6-methylase TrmN6